MHLVYPPKFYITIVLVFSSDDYNTQEKLGTTVMKNLGGGMNKVHYGPCENGEFWEILLVESGTLRRSLQFERKKLLQKAVGFEPTTQMVQYCRFLHDVTIIQNKKQFFSSNATRKGSFHTNERKNKWAAIVKEVYNGNWRTFNRKRKHFSKWILAEIPVLLNQIRAKSVRHEAKTLWQPWTWLFRLKLSLKTAWQKIGRKKPLHSRHLA